MNHEILEFAPNVPQEIALAFSAGKIINTPGGMQRVLYTLTSGKVMFMDLDMAQRINSLGVKAHQPFFVVKNKGAKRTDPVEWRAWVSPEVSPGEQRDGTFVVPSNGKPAAGGSHPPATVSTDSQTADTGHNGSTNGSNGHAAVTAMPAERAKTKLEAALKTVVAAVFAATQYAKQIGYQIPPFTSEDIRTMANTIIIQNGGGK